MKKMNIISDYYSTSENHTDIGYFDFSSTRIPSKEIHTKNVLSELVE